MGARFTKQFEVNRAGSLGAGDKHCTYINFLYENLLEGGDDTKFERFNELICNSVELQ